MKPAPFAYDAPEEIEGALALLAEHGDDAKVLAGGQSLIPLLNFRLASPSRLIDITRIPSLTGIERRDGSLLIGATTRQAELERAPETSAWPVMVEAVRQVAHPQIRNAGTVGGSLVHADPAAELPTLFVTLDARFHVRSAAGERTVEARDFFLGPFTTALEPDEMLIAIEVPALPGGAGTAFVEFARRDGDFALGGAAALIELDGAGGVRRLALTLLGASAPHRSTEAEEALAGRIPDQGAIAEAAHLALAGFEPAGDIHGSAAYRKHLGEVMARKAISLAVERAGA